MIEEISRFTETAAKVVNDVSESNKNIDENNNALGIGANGAGSYPFPGQIDDVRIYNFGLTQEQVKQVMNDNSAVRFGD